MTAEDAGESRKAAAATEALAEYCCPLCQRLVTAACYALHCCVGTVFGRAKPLAYQRPPSGKKGDKASEDGVWLPMWRGNKSGGACRCPTAWTAQNHHHHHHQKNHNSYKALFSDQS